MRRIIYVLTICALVLGIAACGSDSGVKKKETGVDGRVSVRNDTGHLNPDSDEVEITVEYTDADGVKHTITVPPGQVMDVTGDNLIKGGEQVRLIIRAAPSDGTYRHFQQTIPIKVTVDGNTEVRIEAVRDGAQIVGSGFEKE